MNVLIIGRSGQLAAELQQARWPNDARPIALGRSQIDLTDAAATATTVAAQQPAIIVNAAGYTAVDRAETERAQAFAINELGPKHLAAAAAGLGVPLIHVSTDYVFSGGGQRPWRETDEPRPLSVYGQSKLAGEHAVAATLRQYVILRTSWVFAAHGQNFLRTMLRLGKERNCLSIVDDQCGCPTAAADLARVIIEVTAGLLRGHDAFGIYHYAGKEAVSWFQFARAIFELARDLVPELPLLVPITTAEFAAPAPRPANSVLDCAKIEHEWGVSRAFWRDGLTLALATLRAAEF